MIEKLLTGVFWLVLAMVLVPFLEMLVVKYFMPEERGWEQLEFLSNLIVFTDTAIFIGGVLAIGYWMGQK